MWTVRGFKMDRRYISGMKKSNFKIIFVLLIIVFLASIVFSINDKVQSASITVLPQVPKEGEPLFVTFNLNNPSQKETLLSYEFYANGDLLLQGKELIPPFSTKRYSYIYPKSPELGERTTFLVKTDSEIGSYNKMLSVPAYAPQVMSSFVSFASFSTSLISSSMSSSITSQQFYDGSFADNNKLNVGLIFSIVLILLLIYLELTEHLKDRTLTITGGMRIRFSRLSAILFIVFIGMVFTKGAMII